MIACHSLQLKASRRNSARWRRTAALRVVHTSAAHGWQHACARCPGLSAAAEPCMVGGRGINARTRRVHRSVHVHPGIGTLSHAAAVRRGLWCSCRGACKHRVGTGRATIDRQTCSGPHSMHAACASAAMADPCLGASRVCQGAHLKHARGGDGAGTHAVVGAPTAAGMHACDTASTMHGMPSLTRCACMQPMRVRGCLGVATVRCTARHPCTHAHHTAPGSAHVLDACWLQTGAAGEVGSAGRRRGGAAPSPRRAPRRTLCPPQPAPIDATTP